MNEVDNRIVKMTFDNAQFESKVSGTLGTLDKLKTALNFGKSSNGMDDLANSTNTVSSRFSALEIIALTALQNITNSVVNLGKRMLSDLTIAPISQGFGEYELKMGSVQTIMNSSGESLAKVNSYLNELNEYADRTIYSFSDMTTNIGKFTNAGVSLDKAVLAIKGVSNEAAVSGANANEASRAMYNFAQALSAGSVKLIDWKSIENANMATVEFKQQLLDTALALGTVVKEGDKYKTTTTDLQGKISDVFDATHAFNDSLSHQWMTTDVLVETLAKYADETTEIGKKAYKAATEVKTFSQLIDTLKEAVGTGWADTFEIVFGNFEEAKALWTGVNDAISGIVDSQAKARNALLSSWKELGGRTAILQTIANLWNSLSTIAGAISQAFKEMVPPITGQSLAELSKRISVLSLKLKVSDETADKIKRTFSGFFAVIRLGLTILKSVASLFGSFVKAVLPLSGGLLDATANLGDFVKNLVEGAERSQVFQNAARIARTGIELLGKAVKWCSDLISKMFPSDFLKNVSNIFGSIVGALGTGLGKLADIFSKLTKSEAVIQIFESLFSKIASIGTGFGNAIRFAADAIGSFFSKGINTGNVKLLEGLSKFLSPLIGLFKDLASAVAGGISNLNFESVVASISSIFMLMSSSNLKKVLDGVSDFVNGFSDNFVKPFTGMFEPFTGILENLGNTLRSFQQGIQAKNLLTIAKAVGVLAISIALLGQLDAQQLLASVTAISAVFKMLTNITNSLGKIDRKKAGAITTLANSLKSVAKAVLVLAVAVRVLGGMDLTSLATGLVGVGVLLYELAVFIKKVDTSGNMSKASKGLIKLALALNIMANAVKKLGALSFEQLIKGLAAVGILLLELSLFLSKSNFDKHGSKAAKSMLVIAVAMNIFASAVSGLGSLPVETIIKGLASIGVILLEIVGFAKLLGNNSKGLLSTSVAMVIISLALKSLTSVISDLGSLSLSQIVKGLSAMGVVLAELVIALNSVSKSGALKASVSIAVMSKAVTGLSAAMMKLAGLDLKSACVALLAIGGVLAEIVIAAKLLSGTKSLILTAAALIVFAGAIAILTPSLIMLGQLSLGQIVKALLAIAGAFAVLGVAGALLGPLAPAILALSAALALMGVGVFALGAGVVSLSAGLASLAAGGVAHLTFFLEAVKMVLKAIPDMITIILGGFADVLAALGKNASAIFTSIGEILSAILLMLAQLIPDVCTLFLELIKGICRVIVEGIPYIVVAAAQLVIGLCNGLAAQMPALVQAAFNLLIAFINGFASAITGNYGAIYAACGNLIVSIGTAFIQLIPTLIGIGGDLIKALVDGLFSGISTCWDKVQEVATSFVDGIKSFFHVGDAGKGEGEKIANNLASSKDSVAQAASDVGTTATNSLKESLSDTSSIGEEFSSGIIDGMSGASESVSEIGTETGQSFTNSLQDAMANIDTSGSMDSIMASISSYSGSFSEAGLSSMTSFSAGMESGTSHASGAIDGVLNEALSGISHQSGSFLDGGLDSIKSFADGESNGTETAKSKASKAASDSATAAGSKKNEFITAGYNAMAGMAQGISNGESLAVNAAASAAANALAAAKKELKTHSPSRRFEKEVGLMAVKGFALGISKNSNLAEDAASDMGDSSLSSIKLVMDRIRELFVDDFNLNPVITPVIDSTKIQNGTAMISSLFKDQSISMDFSSESGRIYAESAAGRMRQMATANKVSTISKVDISSGNQKIVEELTNLRTDVNALNHSILNMKLYLNKKALVGGIVQEVDSALGTMADRKLRSA